MESLLPRRITFVGPGGLSIGKGFTDGQSAAYDLVIDDWVGWRTVSYAFKGLRNSGNTCYLNSALQCLTHLSPLANYAISCSHSNVCSKGRAGLFCAYCALEKHIRQVLETPKGVIHPSSIVQNLKQISKSLRPGRQEDSHEFLLRLVDACISSAKGLPGNSAFLDAVFHGRFRSRIECQVCYTPSDCFDPFMDISLDLAGSNTLQDCFRRFTSTEVLQGANAYGCKTCKKKVTARKQFSLDKVPAVLTVQLKRFDVSRNIAGKIHRRIGYPATLDIEPYLSEKRGPCLYDLVGLIVHQGASLSSGHYYSYCRAPSGFWLKCDDECVTQVKVETVLSEMSGAYILFYECQRSIIPSNVSPMDVETTCPEYSCSYRGLAEADESAIALNDTHRTASRSTKAIKPNKMLLSYGKLYFRPANYRWNLSRRLHLLKVFCFLSKFHVRKTKKKQLPSRQLSALLTKEDEIMMPELSLSADTRRQLGMSAASQWGGCSVSCWDDDEDCTTKLDVHDAREAQRELQPLPVQRSQYDVEFDRSSRLQHNPAKERCQLTNQRFSGSRLFDHALTSKSSNFTGARRGRGRGRGSFSGRQCGTGI